MLLLLVGPVEGEPGKEGRRRRRGRRRRIGGDGMSDECGRWRFRFVRFGRVPCTAVLCLWVVAVLAVVLGPLLLILALAIRLEFRQYHRGRECACTVTAKEKTANSVVRSILFGFVVTRILVPGRGDVPMIIIITAVAVIIVIFSIKTIIIPSTE